MQLSDKSLFDFHNRRYQAKYACKQAEILYPIATKLHEHKLLVAVRVVATVSSVGAVTNIWGVR